MIMDMETMTFAETLRGLLTTNIVCFTYLKTNGEIRQAKGTRNLALAEKCLGESIAKPKTDRVNENAYFDIEKGAWRSYVPEKLISIDGVFARTDTEFAKKPTLLNEPPKETKKPELPKRKIPISKPIGGGADIETILGGFFGGLGGNIPKEEIRKSMEDLDKDIVIGAPAHSPKIGTPIATEKGIELPLGSVSVDDFAKLVAHYVVEELVSRLTR